MQKVTSIDWSLLTLPINIRWWLQLPITILLQGWSVLLHYRFETINLYSQRYRYFYASHLVMTSFVVLHGSTKICKSASKVDKLNRTNDKCSKACTSVYWVLECQTVPLGLTEDWKVRSPFFPQVTWCFARFIIELQNLFLGSECLV